MKVINIDNILKEYLYNDAPKKEFNEWYKYNSTDKDLLKYLIIKTLTETERRILLIYIHTGNYLKASQILDVSVGTFHSRIKAIKLKLKDEYNKYIY